MKQLLLMCYITTNLAYAKDSLKKSVWNSLSLTLTKGSLCSWLLLLFTKLLLLASILLFGKKSQKLQMHFIFKVTQYLLYGFVDD